MMQVLQGYKEFKVRVSFRPPSWIFYIYLWLIGTAGAGTMAGEVLHDVGVEVGYKVDSKFGNCLGAFMRPSFHKL